MSNERCTKSGATRLGRGALVAIAVFLGVAVILGWLWLGDGARATGRESDRGTEVVSVPPESEPSALSPAEPPPRRVETTAERELAPFQAHPAPNPRFAGKLGSLRGHIEVTGEEPFPNHWRLVARPSNTLPERESARERSLEFFDGRKDFELETLPLGGYDVCGEAEGFNGQVLPVMLEPGSEHPFVSLRLVPAGTLEGQLLASDGSPAEGVPMTLFAVSDNAARVARTDVLGRYRFEALPDGEYELLVGTAESPLIPERRPLRFQAPHLTFPDIELPLLGALRVRVVDSLERPIEGVEVVGSGTNGGTIEGTTDFNGTLEAKYLPAGHFRVRISHPGIGEQYTRRFAVDVVAGETARAPVRFGP